MSLYTLRPSVGETSRRLGQATRGPSECQHLPIAMRLKAKEAVAQCIVHLVDFLFTNLGGFTYLLVTVFKLQMSRL